MLGSHAWFAFIHEASTNSSPLIIHSNVDPQLHLFLFYADTKPLSECPDKAQCGAHVHNAQFVLDDDNANLSSTQKALLLDHQQLGHVRMSLIQKLHTCPTDTTKPSFIPTDDAIQCVPPLSPLMAGQLKCAAPMCSTCNLAKSKTRNMGVKTTKPNPEKVDIPRDGDLQPGNCISVDQHKSSVCV